MPFDSTTNKHHAREMLAASAGIFAGMAENGAMAKVQTNFKKPKIRHFIRQWRKHRHYTLEDVAEMVGVTHGALSQLERGITNYTQPMLEALADSLACEPQDLIMRNPLDTEAIWTIWEQAKPAQKAAIIDIAKAILRTGT